MKQTGVLINFEEQQIRSSRKALEQEQIQK